MHINNENGLENEMFVSMATVAHLFVDVVVSLEVSWSSGNEVNVDVLHCLTCVYPIL